MTKEDLIAEAFSYLNSFKRHRALAELKPQDRRFHELQMYKMIDYLELGMRAIKKERYTQPLDGGEGVDESSE